MTMFKRAKPAGRRPASTPHRQHPPAESSAADRQERTVNVGMAGGNGGIRREPCGGGHRVLRVSAKY